MRRLASTILSLALAVPAGAVALAAPARAAEAFTTQTLHFKVQTDPSGSTTCDIVGDLYTPTAATSTSRVPAILTTNGFGGSKDDNAGWARFWATRGYAVLSYSGLGFGGSSCKITLDDPDYDGRAGSQLVSYLGGAPGIAYLDAAHTQPAPVLDVVRRDKKSWDGVARPDDPRVAMMGLSYGGAIQFSVAGIDRRLDTIIPMITWNDLTYSLGPNNTGQTGVSSATPGAVKLNWGAGFTVSGVKTGVDHLDNDPTRILGCPNFADWVCPALASAATLGYLQDDAVGRMRHASLASYVSKVRIPTLLLQGQYDTLFNLNEAAATYQALKAQGTPVKMIWQTWGHSNDTTPAPGEFSRTAPSMDQYETARIDAWLGKYLKGVGSDTGPAFAYFRDWISYTGSALPAYGTASAFPVGTTSSWYLSGTGLVPSAPTAGSQSFVTAAGAAPTSSTSLDALAGYVPFPLPEQDLPGTFATWDTAPLAAKADVVGSPTLQLSVSAPAASLSEAAGPAGQLVLFARLQDVAPDGSATNLRNLTAPVRIADVDKPFTVTMPGLVYRFAAGHRIRLVVSGASVNYKGGLVGTPVTISTGSTTQVLRLPLVP